jgi:hypothetical protein
METVVFFGNCFCTEHCSNFNALWLGAFSKETKRLLAKFEITDTFL